MSTCRIVLVTSLAWLLIDVILIMKYTDGLNGGIFKRSKDNEVRVKSKLKTIKFTFHFI
jgi:polypeptide N-acetylgalactosaminyltransferase